MVTAIAYAPFAGSGVELEAGRAGQVRLALPGVPREQYATGQQEPCVDCTAAGLVGQGVSRDGPDSDALCLSCWRARQRRDRFARPRSSLTAEESGWLAELAEQLACETCQPDAQPTPRSPGGAGGRVDLPPAAVQARRRQRRQQRRREPRRPVVRRAGCWRCGDAQWVASARAVHTADQAQAAADLERAEELRAEQGAALRRVRRARRRLAFIQAWQAEVAAVAEAMPVLTKTGPKGRLQLKRAAGGRARAVWLIADFLARAAADRTARGLSGRGRPSQHPLVVGVMAIAANSRAGRRSMAGLRPTAAYAGVVTKTVTNAWAYSVQVGATVRTEKGRTCSLAEREETGLHRRRAVYDFAQLHSSPFDPVPFLGAAGLVVARLQERAAQLVDEHQAVLDEAVQDAQDLEAAVLDAEAMLAEHTAAELLWQAEVSADWSDDARVAVAAATAARGRANTAAAPPVDARTAVAADRARDAERAAAAEAVLATFERAERMAIFYDPPRMGSRRRSSSGLRGYDFSGQPTSPIAGSRRPTGRGEGQKGGASRPSPTRRVPGHARSEQPRTLQGLKAAAPARPRRSEVMAWAKPLTRALIGRWDFLRRYVDDAADGRRHDREVARERGLRIAMIASTLGGAFGPRWGAGDVVRLVENHGLTGRYAETRSVIAPGDAHSPLRYLKIVCHRALTDPAATVPHHSPIRERVERELLAAQRAAGAARTAALRDELGAVDAAAAAERGGPGTGRAAARAIAAQIAARRDAERQARADRLAGAWPEPAQPGSGLPVR